MGRLVAVEVRRLLSRRLVRVTALLAIAGIVIGGVVTLVRSHPHAAVGFAGPAGSSGSVVDPGFQLAHLTDVFKGTEVPLALVSWLLAASFVGAEWHAGTIGTLLTWEPRRLRVLAAKAVAAIAFAFVATVAFQVVLGLALIPAGIRGTTAGIDGVWFRTTAGVVLRGAVLSSDFAAVGFSIAFVARHTAAALGVGFAYLLILEQFLAALRPGWRSWMLLPNAVVFVDGHQHLEVANRSVLGAGLLLIAYALGTLAVSGALFQRRDVT